MSLVTHTSSSSLSGVQSLPPSITPPKPQETPPKPLLQAKSDGLARAQQQRILDAMGKDHGVTGLERAKVLTGEGMKAVLGEGSRHANIKDGVMRASHKLLNRLEPDDGMGSVHKSAIRLAEKYHQQVESGAPEKERLATLKELKDKLQDMHGKEMADAVFSKKELPMDTAVTKLVRFVDHEIAMLPGSHLEKAKDLYAQFKGLKLDQQDKMVHMLDQMHDHLNAVDPQRKDPLVQAARQEMTDAINSLKLRSNMKEALTEFREKGTVEGQKLKHVKTEVHALTPREAYLMEKQQQKIEGDRERAFDQEMVNWDIEGFEPATLKKTETRETSGLRSAKNDYDFNSLGDQSDAMDPLPVTQGKAKELSEPSLKDLPPSTTKSSDYNQLGKHLSLALNDGDKDKANRFSDELGQRLAKGFSELPREQQLALITSSGDQLKQELYKEIAAQEGADPRHFPTSFKDAPDTIKDFLDKAVSVAASHLSDRQVDANTIVLNGVTYSLKAEIGSTASGKVYMFEGMRGDKPHQISVTIPTNPKPEDFDATAQEARTHFAATEKGSDNVVQFMGAVRSPDGGLIIATEFTPGGNLAAMSKRIEDAEKQGHISPTAANRMRITLFKDMARGLQHLQENGGMMHNNFQPSSFTIGTDGNAKLRSFGAVDRSLDATVEAMQGDPHSAPPESLVDVFRFQAGRGALESVSSGLAELEKQITAKDFSNALREMDTLSKALDRFERANGSDPDYPVKYKELRAQIEEIREEAKKSPQQADLLTRLSQKLHDDMKPVFDAHQKKHLETPLSYQASGKSDTWALGVAAYEMLTGRQFNATKNLSQLEEVILNHANEGGLDEIPDPRGGNASGSGVGALGRLLNRVLSNDPGDRPSITDVLNHSLFLEPGVDSDEVRELIKLMGNPSSTPAQLKTASDAIGV